MENKAVFLSYASQDAEAARRICEALRAAGVEVWFDQSELRGGDAWDAKIRKQIKECALFVPVISANTQARREGYFRIEWKLAAQRTHAMAEGTPFLLPLVIDDTPEVGALVPPEFGDVQWTRLPAGAPLPGFCARVKTLLDGAGLEAGRPRIARRDEGVPSSGKPAAPRPAFVPIVLVASAAVAFAALVFWRPWGATATAAHSEAQELVSRARTMLANADEARREVYFLAEDLIKKGLSQGEIPRGHAVNRDSTAM